MIVKRGTLIVVTGPESAGKTTLVRELSLQLGCPPVPEVARERLADRPVYAEQDICRLALLQYRQIEEALHRHPLAIADTDLLTYRIWLQWRYGRQPRWLQDLHRHQRPFLYLLCTPDLPWQPDPLRENPTDRESLFQAHREILGAETMPFRIVTGQGPERLRLAQAILEKDLPRNTMR